MGFLFQINNYIFPLILIPFIFLGPLKKFRKPVSLLVISAFFIILTASLHSIPLLQYISASIPIFFILLGWLVFYLFKGSIIQQGILVGLLVSSNIVHVIPLIPIKQILPPSSTEAPPSLYMQGIYQTFMREVEIKSIFFEYWRELANPYRGPLDKIVAFFETHGKKGETCYIDNEVESLAFYTGFKMIHNNELTTESRPDWIVLRGDQWDIHSDEKMNPPSDKIKLILENSEYEQIILNAPVNRVNNSYEVQIHLFQSPTSTDKVYIYRRSGII
jgi:hypothetical protein